MTTVKSQLNLVRMGNTGNFENLIHQTLGKELLIIIGNKEKKHGYAYLPDGWEIYELKFILKETVAIFDKKGYNFTGVALATPEIINKETDLKEKADLMIRFKMCKKDFITLNTTPQGKA